MRRTVLLQLLVWTTAIALVVVVPKNALTLDVGFALAVTIGFGTRIWRARRRRRRVRASRTARLQLRHTGGRKLAPQILESIDDEVRHAFGWDDARAVRQSLRPHVVAHDAGGELVGVACLLVDRSGPPAILIRMWIVSSQRRRGYGVEMLAGLVPLVARSTGRVIVEAPEDALWLVAPLHRLGFRAGGRVPRAVSDGGVAASRVTCFVKDSPLGTRRRLRTWRIALWSKPKHVPMGAPIAGVPLGIVQSERVTLRQATRLDAREVSRLLGSRAMAGVQSSLPSPLLRRLVRRRLGRGHAGGQFVVLDAASGTVVGFMSLLQRTSRDRSTVLFGLQLAPSHQRIGLGPEIVRAMQPRLRELGVQVLACALIPETTFLIPTLLGLGFRRIGHLPGRRVGGALAENPLFHLELDRATSRTSATSSSS